MFTAVWVTGRAHLRREGVQVLNGRARRRASPELRIFTKQPQPPRQGAAPQGSGVQPQIPRTCSTCSEQPTSAYRQEVPDRKHLGTKCSWKTRLLLVERDKAPNNLVSINTVSIALQPAVWCYFIPHSGRDLVQPLPEQGHPAARPVGSGWRLAAYLQ